MSFIDFVNARPRLKVIVVAAMVIGFWGYVATALTTDDETARPTVESAPETPAYPSVIDEWLTSWSEAQAAEFSRVCESDPECEDSSKYLPEVRPSTSFGWDGAEQVEQIEDWARGPRYRVRANGRRLLIYLEAGTVVGVYVWLPSGVRRNVCRDADCQT